MRRPQFELDHQQTMALLTQSTWSHVAMTNAQGDPIIRAMHLVWVDGRPFMHGAPKGERHDSVPSAVTVSVEEVIASIPSYFTHPERACPATTFYRSAQLHGTLYRVEDDVLKARVLQALMEHNQPEGRYRPITTDDSMYRNAVRQLDVLGIQPSRVYGKAKLGQQLKPDKAQALLENLWCRGLPSDADAIEHIIDAYPERLVPPCLALHAPATSGWRMRASLNHAQRIEAAALTRDEYWNAQITPSALEDAWHHSDATVGIFDQADTLIACARAVSDFGKRAWIYDVLVHPNMRGLGLGQRMMQTLLDHPNLRQCGQVLLGTRDAQTFYAQLGFEDVAPAMASRQITQMAHVRGASSR